jgi:hypothetical protein
MPIRRVGLYGGLLGGAGDTLQLLAATRIKRREREQDQAEQRAWEMQKLQMNALAGISEKIAADPTKAKALIQAASSNPFLANLRPVIEGMRPSDPTIAAELQRQIGTVKSAADLPDVSRVAAAAGINTTQMPPTMPSSEPLDVRPDEMPAPPPQVGLTREMGQAPYAPPITPNIAPAETLLPELKARFAHNNPVIEDLQRGVTEQGTQIRQGQEDALSLAGREAEAKSTGTATGTANVAHQFNPTVIADTNAMTEGTSASAAAAAGDKASAEAQARFDVDNSPTAITAAVRKQWAINDVNAASELKKQRDRVTNGVIDPQRQQAIIQSQNAYQQDTKNYRGKEQAYRTLLASAGPELGKGKGGLSPAAGVSLIFAYMKMVDPSGSVQQGEANRLQNAQGLEPWLVNLYYKTLNGNPLAQETIADFLHQGYLQYQGAKGQQLKDNARYTNLATNAFQVPAEWIIQTPDPELDKDPTAGYTVGSSATKPATPGVRHDINGNPIP